MNKEKYYSVTKGDVEAYGQYASALGDDAKETPIVKHLEADKKSDVDWRFHGKSTLKELIDESRDLYGTRPCLGWRTDEGEHEVENEEGVMEMKTRWSPYNWLTYEESISEGYSMARAMKSRGLANNVSNNGKTYNFIGLYAKNCKEWIITDIASMVSAVTPVTLYDTLGAESSSYILGQCEITTVFTSNDKVKNLAELKTSGEADTLENIVTFDEPTGESKRLCEDAKLTLYTYKELVATGKSSSEKLEVPNQDTLYTILYTSGTTGNPKGVMLTHKNFVSVSNSFERADIVRGTDVHLSYLPLAHSMERMVEAAVLSNGASMGFFHGDVFELKLDLAELRPTLFVSVPRLWNKMADGIKKKIADLKGIKLKMGNKAVAAKLGKCKKTGNFKHCVWDKLVFKKMRQVVGGRVRVMVSGSAPLSKDTISFLKCCFSVPLLEAYGLTETLYTSSTVPEDRNAGFVGGVAYTQDLKLVDVPEMNYFATDKKEGISYPRGEICYRGSSIFSGYFKDEERTEEAFDKDGWFHTGDIGELQANLALRIIDRKKNIFKLSQGEYIAPEKLEQCYLKSYLIGQIFVYGDSLHNNLVAIIIPDK